MVGITIPHYKIISKLGEGGMGLVYKARKKKPHRLAALEFPTQHLLWGREAKSGFFHKATSILVHSNITAIYEADELDGECSIYMKRVEGKSTKQLLLVTDNSQSGPRFP
jgi:serine/threonine-protein kinase